MSEPKVLNFKSFQGGGVGMTNIIEAPPGPEVACKDGRRGAEVSPQLLPRRAHLPKSAFRRLPISPVPTGIELARKIREQSQRGWTNRGDVADP